MANPKGFNRRAWAPPKYCSMCRTPNVERRRAHRCAPCQKVYFSQWRARQAADPSVLVTRRKRERRNRLWREYGLLVTDYERMMTEQSGQCKICRMPAEENVKRNKGKRTLPGLDVDHSHSTGKVRGLLCFKCNMGLAAFRDRPELLSAAIEYLEATSG